MARKHPFKVDPRDMSRIWFFDPEREAWFAIRRKNAADPDMPFSRDALRWAKRLLIDAGGDVSDRQAVSHQLDDLLDRHLREPDRLSNAEQKIVLRIVDNAVQAGIDLSAVRDFREAGKPLAAPLDMQGRPVEPATGAPLPTPPAGEPALPVDDGPNEADYDLDAPIGDDWPEPLETLS
jgi:hypothetical protein